MPLPTEPIGSIPRPTELIDLIDRDGRGAAGPALAQAEAAAIADTLARFEATGSPVVTDGEQRKPSFLTYPIAGHPHLGPGRVALRFADGHERLMPTLVAGPLRYRRYAVDFLREAQARTRRPVKQAVISPSALLLLYPEAPIPGYPRECFLADLMDEAERDIRQCLDAGAHCVQLDFTEARYSIKVDPTLALLEEFIQINNWVLERFSDEERRRIGVHTCPGGDRDSTHSADVAYEYLLPALFRLKAGRFYVQLASERDRPRVLRLIRASIEPGQLLFAGVIDPLDPRVESAAEVRDRVLEAAELIPLDQLGTTDDCGFAPFADDRSTPREVAFAKIAARVEGTRLASARLGR